MTLFSPPIIRPLTRLPTGVDHPSPSGLPTDLDELFELAERLEGRPVPGIRLTERQFLSWYPEKARAEWDNGDVILMGRTSGDHSDITVFLVRLLAAFVERHDLGLIRGPEFLMRLGGQRKDRIPDVLFVSNARMHLVRKDDLNGPADLAVEVVSRDSTVRDWRTKYQEYERAGVREYWVIDPLVKRFEAYSLRGKTYRLLPVDEDGRVCSKMLRGLYVRPAWFWRSPLPKMTAVLKEIGT
jgi:Uma2 family endonuclease